MTPRTAQGFPVELRAPVDPRATGGPGATSGLGAVTHWLVLLAVSGWAAALAMLLVLVFSPARPANPAARRAELIEIEPDTQVLVWATEGVRGDVTWSDARNEGYLRIEGLPVNHPEQSRYQLWIFRGTDMGAEPYPVDGGVFDVSSEGEVTISIDARLDVGGAGLFAITVEDPGGVVVSEREQVVAIASRA